MNWELYQRHQATLVLILVAAVSFLLLAFQRSSPVRDLKALLVFGTLPAEHALSNWTAAAAPRSPGVVVSASSAAPMTEPQGVGLDTEKVRQLEVLKDENQRLRELLDLKNQRWPKGIAAQVVGRDPQRWFQEILLDKGGADGIRVDAPVVTPLKEGREALVGRVIETNPHVSKVMLVLDSLSAVAATVEGKDNEDGVVEGNNGHDLSLEYISRDSPIKIGDAVITSGLGGVFPEGISIGWVRQIDLGDRQLFLEARLQPAMNARALHSVLVLVAPSS